MKCTECNCKMERIDWKEITGDDVIEWECPICSRTDWTVLGKSKKEKGDPWFKEIERDG